MICSLLIVNVLANAPLRPVLKDVGSVTAGNSSSISYSHLLDYLFPLPLSPWPCLCFSRAQIERIHFSYILSQSADVDVLGFKFPELELLHPIKWSSLFKPRERENKQALGKAAAKLVKWPRKKIQIDFYHFWTLQVSWVLIFDGLGVSSPNLRFCRLNICTKRPQSGVWMN